MRPRTCNFLLALLKMEETCWSKLSSETIKIPNKVSFVLVVSEASLVEAHQSGFWNSKVNDNFQIGFKMIILVPVKKFVRDKF